MIPGGGDASEHTIGIYVAFACYFYNVSTRVCPHPIAMAVIPNDDLNVGE